MISRKYETVVGIFVLASLIALLVMVLIIAQQEGLFQEYVEYRAVFKNVSGLRKGSEVHISGVTVGTVRKITITPEGQTVVTFEVKGGYAKHIRKNSQASIGFMGLLGEKSLDITAGSMKEPPIPPEGAVASVEPLDVTELLAKAGPSLEDLQKILGDFRQIIAKINEGKGTLGLLLNNPDLYNESTQTAASAHKFISDLNQSVFGPTGRATLRKQAGQAFSQFQETLSTVNQVFTNFRAASTSLPGMVQKLDSFLTNLDKAGKGLPGLMNEAETTLGNADKAAKAVNQSWFFRKYVPKPQEHTLQLR